ncbi:MAG: hypothetical protein BGO57_14120 [Sphingomonadales bacterium 63-6]|nr:MAG: hypothetical protein BGO57_14120 [Sphingomonadales bacterium 63-6]
MDEHVLTAAFLLDEAKALAGIEELHRTLAGTDDLGGHTAAAATTATRAAEATTAAAARAAEAATTAATRSAAKAITTAETVATTKTIGIAEPVMAAEPRSAIHERVKTVFADMIPLVASPAATTSVKTHET